MISLFVSERTLNVMAPEAIADIGAGHAKVGLVSEVLPAEVSHVAAETHLVAVIAQTAPARQHHTTIRTALAFGIYPGCEGENHEIVARMMQRWKQGALAEKEEVYL